MEVQLYKEHWDYKHCIELLWDLMKYWNIKTVVLKYSFQTDIPWTIHFRRLRWLKVKDIQCSNVVDTKRKLVTKSLNEIHPVLNDILLWMIYKYLQSESYTWFWWRYAKNGNAAMLTFKSWRVLL